MYRQEALQYIPLWGSHGAVVFCNGGFPSQFQAGVFVSLAKAITLPHSGEKWVAICTDQAVAKI